MKKIVTLLLCVCTAITLFVSGFIFAVESDKKDETTLEIPQPQSDFDVALNSGLIKRQVASYNSDQKYGGKKITNPHIDVASFATLEVLSSGGTHTDGDGNLVFSNFVAFSVFFNFDKSSKYIAGTDVKVSDDKLDWNDMNEENDYKYSDPASTEKPISYGVIAATRTDAYGNAFKYTPVFSTGNTSFEQQFFNEDGDYTIYVFFETCKNGKYQNHILSWSFKVRTAIYLRDVKTDLHIKNSGLSGGNVIIDAASRQGVEVELYKYDTLSKTYKKDNLPDDMILTDSGSYKFIVKNNGFVCEVFYFVVDKEDIDNKVFFSNLRRKLGNNSYEAEGYFSFEWDENITNPIQTATYRFCDGTGKDLIDYKEEKFSEAVDYTSKTVLDQVGTYLISVYDGKQWGTFYINVVPMDKPSTNYDKLSSERFNTFKTKWWQVYDESSGRYLCFDYDTEFNRAYNAAMTIANNSVIDGTGRYFFKGAWYNDRIELTAAMNEYVFAHNLSVFYYDPADYTNSVESERTFSLQAFDNTIYLNDEFQFVAEHPSEVISVILTDADGNEYDIEFSTPISEQGQELKDGEYTVKETDKYGNERIYTAYRDKSAPEIVFTTDNGEITALNGESYNASYFSISSLLDKYDEYAVIKIASASGVQYFYKTEYSGIVFENVGVYTVSAYDRNGNSIEFTITIS